MDSDPILMKEQSNGSEKSSERIKKTYIPNQSCPEGVIEFMIITETDSLYRI